MTDLNEFKQCLKEQAFGKESDKNIASGLCINCKQPALERCYSLAGKREYEISGLCELCFDEITKE